MLHLLRTPARTLVTRHTSTSLNLIRRLVPALFIAALVALPLWLGPERARSAPPALAGALLVPSPSVTINAPAQVLVGAQAKFKVKFDNANDVGYGPFLDLVLDAGGANLTKTNANCACDGLKFVSARMVGVNGGPLALTNLAPTPVLTTPCVGAPANVAHPFAASGVLPVSLPAGGQLVTLALPFGSFDPTQPPIEVEVTVDVSNLADVNYPLKIYARGGFRYGTDPLDNYNDPNTPDPPVLTDMTSLGAQITNSAAWNAQAQVTPTVMLINKSYLGPEGENATGPNFIGYYPLRYKLTVEVAPGQTLTNVVLTDCLPDNMAFHQLVSVTPAAGPVTLPQIDVPASSNCLTINWPSLSGNAEAVFEFFIPEHDAGGSPVLPPDCSPADSKDTLSATADWTPLDACDTPQQIKEGPVVDNLLDKCIAIQKSVALFKDTGAPGFTPGDILRYTLDFQISDFKTFGSIDVADVLADGQKLISSAATLTVNDRFGPPLSGSFVPGSDLLVAPDAALNCGGVKGGTQLTFLVSQKMMNLNPAHPRRAAGILTGGHASTPASATPATGRIVFFAGINDEFDFAQTPGDKFVDKEDPINNCVEVGGKVLTNVGPKSMPASTGVVARDDSGTSVSIVGDTLVKTVYAVRRRNALGVPQPACGPGSAGPCSNSPSAPQDILPGDHVTFRLTKTIPSTDAENLAVVDWLPRPTFDVTGVNFSNTQCGVPAVGDACYASAPFPSAPSVSADPVTNSVKFDYGTFNDTSNTPHTIDLLFTYEVTNLPFADGLFLTNEAQECETNTFGASFCQAAVVQVKLRQPDLRVRKGVVAASVKHAVYTPAPPLPPGVVFNAGGYVSGLNSSNVANLNSNVSNVDANDLVTFAITIENAGGAPAYDIKLTDLIPSDALGNPTCFAIVPNTMQIKRGTGATVAPGVYLVTPPPPGTAGFTVTANPLAPIPLPAPGITPGANIVVITFQVRMLAGIKPGCCDNLVRLEHYASTHGGPSFVKAGVNAPYADTASVCVAPKLTKSVVATSEPHTSPALSTTPQNAANTPPLAIGEIVRYRLLVAVPEGGALSNFQVTDALPPGMKLVGANAARVGFIANSPGGIVRTGPFASALFSENGNGPVPSASIANNPQFPPTTIAGGAGCGVPATPVVFHLGNIHNVSNDNDLEYVQIEFNALVCNVPGNQHGVTLANTFGVSAGGAQLATSNAINVNVVEPALKIAKTVSPATTVPGGAVSYAITITNPAPLPAFDVKFTDVLPPGLTLASSALSVTGNCLPAPVLSLPSPAVACQQIPANGTVVIKYKAVANAPSCPATLTNKAAVTWTSLPGNGTPVGFNNTTGTVTPGASGASDGERNGVTAPPTLNDYAASASASLNIPCPPCAKPPAGMVAWWPLDEPNGAAALKDIAAVNNQGVPKPGSPVGSANAPGSVAGRVGGALNFNPNFQQNGPHVEAANHPELNFGTGDLSIDAWVFVPKPPAVYLHPVVDKLAYSASGTQGTGYALSLVSGSAGSRLQFTMGTGGALANYLGPNAPSVPYNTWTHVTATVGRSTGAVTFYVNGAALASSGPPMPAGSVNNNLPLLLGESRAPGRVQAAITLDEVELFNRRLAQQEIQAIVNAGPAGKCKCLLVREEKVACGPNGTYTYTFSLTNSNVAPATTINFAAAAGVTVSPATISIPPLAPGASITVSVNIGGPGAVPGGPVCLFIGLAGSPIAPACRVEHCIKLPDCPTTSCAKPPPGMVSWWPLDETGGSVAADIMGGQHGATSANIGADPLSAASPKVNNALLFVNSRATVAGGSYNFGAGSFSIDAWVRGPVGNAALGIVDKLDTSAVPTGFSFFIRGGSLRLIMGNGTATPSTFASAPNFNYGQWQHVAVTVQRGSGTPLISFYLNGALINTFTPPPQSVNNNVPLLLGSHRYNVGCGSCEVSLDEIEIFKGVVTAADVLSIFKADKLGKCRAALPSGLVGPLQRGETRER